MIQPEIEDWLDWRCAHAAWRLLDAKERLADRRLPKPISAELRAAILAEVNDFADDMLRVLELLSTGDVLVNGVALGPTTDIDVAALRRRVHERCVS